MDKRDDLTWVTLELTRPGEIKVEEGVLEELIRKDLRLSDDHPIFIPSLSYPKNGKYINIHLLEGYAFVASGLPETTYFALEKKFYVNRVMSTQPHSMRVLSVVSNADILDMKRQLQQLTSSDIEKDTHVRVTEGSFASLEGIVVLIEGSYAFVQFEMRTLNLLVKVPRVFLEAIS